MKGLEFAILKLGEVGNDRVMNIAGLNLGTVDDKQPRAVWFRLPSIAILIRHPTAGYLLYDTGNYMGNEADRLPASLKKIGAYYFTRNDFIDRQLDRIGIGVCGIESIILSHGHFDHAGGVGFFAGTKAGYNVCISRVEFETALLESHRTPEGFGNAYNKGDYEFSDITYQFVEEGLFLSGIELIALPGHTRGTLGMVLHCTNHSYIFPSDALYTARNFGPPAMVPGLVEDTRGFYESVKKVKTLQKVYNASIIYPHDLEQLNGLSLAPYFYS